MKTQRRPFAVEVKRGTSRSAFIVKEPVSEIHRKAEEVLFRAPQAGQPIPSSRPITGRILRSIIDVSPVSELPTQVSDTHPRRPGRPPGATGKTQARLPSSTIAEALPALLDAHSKSKLGEFEPSLEHKRRERPSGLKNKLKAGRVKTAIPRKVYLGIKGAGVTLDENVFGQTTQQTDFQSATTEVEQVASEQSQAPVATTRKQERLRDRSKILRRYVWGTHSMLGQGGLRHRRLSPP